MAAASAKSLNSTHSDELSEKFKLNLKLVDDDKTSLQQLLKKENQFQLPLKDLYKIAYNFYKEKLGKAINLSYENNLKLIALTQQALHGPFNSNSCPELGVLDIVGRDRRMAWQNLGSMSNGEAMELFIDTLDKLSPLFNPYLEAIKKDMEERLKKEEQLAKEAREKEKKILNEHTEKEELRYKEELQRRQLQDVLNQQTFQQFKEYAEKQFPTDFDQQGVLIRQLQNEHFHQYMAQLHSSQNSENPLEIRLDQQEILSEKDNDGDDSDFLVISPAKMWTRPDIAVFKKEVSNGSGDGVINIGHGEVVTVRVPVHEGGSCIFWEFASDNYDIGFGLYFEWSKPVSNEVTVHISESDDEDESLLDENDEEYVSDEGDLESGAVSTHRGIIQPNRPPVSILVPVYRRECQNEVYVGSHPYPGEGENFNVEYEHEGNTLRINTKGRVNRAWY